MCMIHPLSCMYVCLYVFVISCMFLDEETETESESEDKG